jgi:hypothetical protein
MNTKLLARAILVLFMGAGSAIARTAIPNTPAGHVLQAWLNAFNSGSPTLIKRYVLPLNPYQSLADVIAFRHTTGGFDLLAIESSEPMHLQFLVKQKQGHVQAVGDLLLKSISPLASRYFALRALPPGTSPAILTWNSAFRGRVIDGLARDLSRYYLDPAVASRMISALRAQQKSGAYRSITDGYVFAEQLTADLRAVSHDKHLQIAFSPFRIPPPPLPMELNRQPPPNMAPVRARLDRRDCAVDQVEVLPGNIGYFKFDAFMDPRICGPIFSAAMATLAHARALIFDLRDNHGGSPDMVDYLASYLFDRRTHLNDVVSHYRGTITQFWTRPYVPGTRMPTQPVFVLTSKNTFSGAEEFCYDLKNLKRATIVGETTGGGSHLVSPHVVADYFIAEVPFGDSINPVSHTDWEGTGVEPDVKVPAAQALRTAEQLAVRDIGAATHR